MPALGWSPTIAVSLPTVGGGSHVHIPVHEGTDGGHRTSAVPGHGLDPGRHFPHGLRRPLPGGGARAPGHASTASGWTRTRSPTREFARFVEETGHVTLAERAPDPDDYPGATPSCSSPRPVVFQQPPRRVSLDNPYNWWTYVPGADWRHPQGPAARSTALAGPSRGPRRLRGRGGVRGVGRQGAADRGRVGVRRARRPRRRQYAWGDELTPERPLDGEHLAGRLPLQNTATTATSGTAPVGTFPPNGYGLYDMTGNVWEWTTDWYSAHAAGSPCLLQLENPRGGERDHSLDPRHAGSRSRAR